MRDSRWDVVVVGGANTDYLVRGPELPRPGATIEGDEFQEAPGGKGANQAVAAARLGARVALIARVGDDERGTTLIERIDDEGVDTHHVLRDAEAPTGVAVIQVDQLGEKQILTAPGANRRLAPRDVRAAAAILRDGKVALLQLEPPLETVIAAAHIAHEAGGRVVLDPAPAVALPDELLRILDVIRPNAGEAKVLTGVTVKDRRSARHAAERLLSRGVRAVAIQAGEGGDLMVWADGERWLPRIPMRAVDATGAGDAFAATLAVMLAEDRPLAEAGRLASAAAALTTTKLGAQAALPRREAVLELADRGGRELRRPGYGAEVAT
jgi:ribokinase